MLRKKVGNETDVPHKIGEVQNCASKEKVQKFSFSANRSQLDVFRSLSRLITFISVLIQTPAGPRTPSLLLLLPGAPVGGLSGRWQSG